ncbi:MAG: hypothetical protein PF693_14345 [Spirochaetia bacterium]|nr:hypothetical protein [Spirochaetia bacterium]
MYITSISCTSFAHDEAVEKPHFSILLQHYKLTRNKIFSFNSIDSLQTEKSYLQWVRRYIYFHNKRHPD